MSYEQKLFDRHCDHDFQIMSEIEMGDITTYELDSIFSRNVFFPLELKTFFERGLFYGSYESSIEALGPIKTDFLKLKVFLK